MPLHGFCDASQAAYAAVTYIKVEDSYDKMSISLLPTKARVKPLKRKFTLPRLELIKRVISTNSELLVQFNDSFRLD